MKSSAAGGPLTYATRGNPDQHHSDTNEHSRISAVYTVRDVSGTRNKSTSNYSGQSMALFEDPSVSGGTKYSRLPPPSSLFKYNNKSAGCIHDSQMPLVQFSSSRPAPPLKGARLGVKKKASAPPLPEYAGTLVDVRATEVLQRRRPR